MPPPIDNSPDRNRGEGEPHSHASFLYVRYTDNPTDVNKGICPAGGLLPGTAFYRSPDITFGPVDGLGNPVVGTDVTVKARVFNGGDIEAFGAYVEFWWFNPALAFTAADPTHRIGSKIVNIPGGNNYVDVECPTKWKPKFDNGGHECLLVQVSCPSEGADDLKFPFAAALDRHVAQHNLMVSNNQPGQKLQLAAGNPFRTTELFTVKVSTLLVSGNMDELRTLNVPALMGLLGSASVGQTTGITGGRRFRLEAADVTQRELGIRLMDIRNSLAPESRQSGDDLTRYINARTQARPERTPPTLGRTLAEFVLQTGESRVLIFDFLPVDVTNGQFLVHRFTQVVKDCDIGGYTVVVVRRDFQQP